MSTAHRQTPPRRLRVQFDGVEGFGAGGYFEFIEMPSGRHVVGIDMLRIVLVPR